MLRRARLRAALIALGVVLVLAGGGFLLAAGFMALANLLGEVRAALIVGAALVLVGCVFVLYARGRPRSFASSSAQSTEPSSLVTTALIDIGRDLGATASGKPGPCVAAAFLIGLVLGRMRR